MKTFLLIALLALAGASCGRRVTNNNLDAVKGGMHPKEVEAILGQPTDSKSNELPLQTQVKTLQTTQYHYEQDGETFTLHFVDDKLTAMEGKLEGKSFFKNLKTEEEHNEH